MDQAVFIPTLCYIHTSLLLGTGCGRTRMVTEALITTYPTSMSMSGSVSYGLLSSCTFLYCIRGAITLP
eukprot:2594321-Prymnesium_polylepis.1